MLQNPQHILIAPDAARAVPIKVRCEVGYFNGIWGIGAHIEALNVYKLCNLDLYTGDDDDDLEDGHDHGPICGPGREICGVFFSVLPDLHLGGWSWSPVGSFPAVHISLPSLPSV